MDIRPVFSVLMRNKAPALLLVLQIAISLAIMLNTACVISFYYDKTHQVSGINEENALFYLQITSAETSTDQQALEQENRYRQIIAAVPGVLKLTDSTQIPFISEGYYYYLQTSKQVSNAITVTPYSSSGSLIDVLGLRLVEGRDFVPSDAETQAQDDKLEYAQHLILSKALARALFPDATTYVGKKLWWGTTGQLVETEIVGVIEQFQMPFVQFKDSENYAVFTARHSITNAPKFIVRTTEQARQQVMKNVEAALRLAVQSPLDIKIDTVNEEHRTYYGEAVTLTWLLSSVCVLLLFITVIGIVGMTTFWVNQRTKQIGIRRALGASQRDIVSQFVIENILLNSIGIGLGSVLAIGLNEWLQNHSEYAKLPISYVVLGAAVFFALGIGAVLVPAWRASIISPSVATNGA